MQVIGLNFNRISAEKSPDFKGAKRASIGTDIDFLDITKEDISMLKDHDVLKIQFNFSINYLESEGKKDSKLGAVSFEGSVLVSAEQEKSKEILKSWKKKEMYPSLKASLYNFIVKETGPKIVQLQKEVGLPSPFLRLPQLRADKK